MTVFVVVVVFLFFSGGVNIHRSGIITALFGCYLSGVVKMKYCTYAVGMR